MKTVVSMPYDLFEAAEKMARLLGISRSQLYQRAVTNYLEEQRRRVVREMLDTVYARPFNRDLDPLIGTAGERTLMDNKW